MKRCQSCGYNISDGGICPCKISKNYLDIAESMRKQTDDYIFSNGGKVADIVIKQGGTKHDDGKPDISLLSSTAVLKIAQVMTFGKKKYDAHNWRKGFPYSRLLSAALRHIFAYVGGETLDPESGISHLAHACCCLMMVLEFETTKPELDDRYQNGK